MNARPKVKADTPLKDIIIEISKGRVGATAVVDDADRVTGVVTDGDVRRMLENASDVRQFKAVDIFCNNPKLRSQTC